MLLGLQEDLLLLLRCDPAVECKDLEDPMVEIFLEGGAEIVDVLDS
jgi:hypothetical protein